MNQFVIQVNGTELESKIVKMETGKDEVIYLSGSIQDCLYLSPRLDIALKFETKGKALLEVATRKQWLSYVESSVTFEVVEIPSQEKGD